MVFRDVLVLLCSTQIIAHSWMSCPRSFNQFRGRGGAQSPPCEGWYLGATNEVSAGDRLKVGWTSNNHGGGYVRIALVKATTTSKADFFGATEDAFQQNVIKFACYGHDTRKGRTRNGDCVHPCNGRPGCEFQDDINDVERLDTTITIPTNLNDGIYIMQLAMLVGNSFAPYYSCAKLSIKGGNPSLNCKSPNLQAPKYTCHRAAGPSLDRLSLGTTRGEFCFHSDRRGEVDDRINETPVNVDCDPRIYCGYSINKEVCYQERGMAHLDMAVSTNGAADPKQRNCGSHQKIETCDDGLKNQGEEGIDCGGPCPNKCVIVATCTDGIKNQDEEGIDCGGLCPKKCGNCNDGIENQDEEGIDCGGSCVAPCVNCVNGKRNKCDHCTDGIENEDETGIDCGGGCRPCATCTDGIQNQGEAGVDCGGPCCKTCLPTCADNILNQEEEGVDCGGPCKPCIKIETIDYFNADHLEKDYGGGPVQITIVMKFLKDVPGPWKLRVEYNQKVDMEAGQTWGAATLVDKNEFGTIFVFQSVSWGTLPKKGETRKISANARKSKLTTTLKPTGIFFEVNGVTELGKRSMDDQKPKKPLTCGGKICALNDYCLRYDVFPCRSSPCKFYEKCSSDAKKDMKYVKGIYRRI